MGFIKPRKPHWCKVKLEKHLDSLGRLTYRHHGPEKKVKIGKKSLLGDKKIEREVTGEVC